MCLPETKPTWPHPLLRDWQSAGGRRADSKVDRSHGNRPGLVPILTGHWAASPDSQSEHGPYTASWGNPSLLGFSKPTCTRWAWRTPSPLELAFGGIGWKGGAGVELPSGALWHPQSLARGVPLSEAPAVSYLRIMCFWN